MYRKIEEDEDGPVVVAGKDLQTAIDAITSRDEEELASSGEKISVPDPVHQATR